MFDFNLYPVWRGLAVGLMSLLLFPGMPVVEVKGCVLQEGQDNDGERRREGRRGDDRGDDRGGDMGRRWDESRGRGDRRGGGWNPEEFLKRLDANGDGKLEGSELSGRTERYLSGMGFDTSKPVLLSAVTEKIRSDRGETTPASEKKEEAPRRVPGFGASTEKVPGFSSTENEEDISTFGEGIIRQVDWVIENYDKDKNRLLDSTEIKDIPAGSPPLLESDTNRDGKLSKLELANRYRAREQFSRRNQGEDREAANGSERVRKNEPGSVERGKFSSNPSTRAGSARRSYSRSSSSRPAGSESSESADRTQRDRVTDQAQVDRTTRYVENIINKYDTDKDGKLSADEIKSSEIRNPPQPDADGFVTREGYVNFLLNPSGASSSSSSDGASDSAKRIESSNDRDPEANRDSSSRAPKRESRFTRREDRGGSESSSRSSSPAKRKVSFEDYDEDASGMIEMHEFAEEWDDATLEQFYIKDKDRDGVITAKEWKGF